MKRLVKRIARSFGYEIRRLPPPAPQLFVGERTALEYELLRAFASRTAEICASPVGTQTMRQVHLAGILEPSPRAEFGSIPVWGERTWNIGIWRRESASKDAAFSRRSDSRNEWFYWADNQRIEPKRRKWRVVLLGESVARGYLYDPHFSPASALEGMLSSELGATVIDVVDLARSNLTIDQLRVLIGRCLALRPDVIVVFAGNNWRTQLTESDIPYVDTLLRREGVPAMKSFLDTRAQEAVGLLRRQVKDLQERHKTIPFIWVVPEFNLGDWVDPVTSAPHLIGDGNQRWCDLDKRCELAIRNHDFALAESLANEMIRLDGGTSSVAPRVLAQCRSAAGDYRGARRWLEMCRDSEGWDPFFSHSPRASSCIQEALRAASSDPANIIVDLPNVLERHFGEILPNRRVFLDYCHLSAEGINVAMAAVASEVMALLAGRKVSPPALLSKTPDLPSKVEGKACFLAAVHNAHFYQCYEVVQYWCQRALEFWPECAQMMRRYVDSQTRRVPFMACKSTLELFAQDDMGMLQYLLRGEKRLDLVLGDAVADSLRKIHAVREADISELRAQEHSITTGPKELTDFTYSSAIPSKWQRAWTSSSLPTNRGSRSIFASAYWETSKFVFFADRGRPVGLKVSYRVPPPSASNGRVEFSVNGQNVAQANASRTWQTLQFSILGDCIVDGMNEIAVSWPEEVDCSEDVLAGMADALVARQLPRFHRIFGDIHSLSVFDALGCAAKVRTNASSKKRILTPPFVRSIQPSRSHEVEPP